MRGNSHDGTRTVGDEDIVGYKNWNLFSGDRVHRRHAVKADAGLILGNLCALKVGLSGGFVLVSTHLCKVFQPVRPFLNHGMFRGNNHICCAVKRVRPCGINRKLVPRRCGEVHFRAGGAANPVLLLRLDTVGIIDKVKIIDQALGILRDF